MWKVHTATPLRGSANKFVSKSRALPEDSQSLTAPGLWEGAWASLLEVDWNSVIGGWWAEVRSPQVVRSCDLHPQVAGQPTSGAIVGHGRVGSQPTLVDPQPSRCEWLPYCKPPALPEVSDSGSEQCR